MGQQIDRQNAFGAGGIPRRLLKGRFLPYIFFQYSKTLSELQAFWLLIREAAKATSLYLMYC